MLYQQEFGLKCDPFTLTPDTRFYCDFPSHEEAMQTIIYAIEEGQSFCLVHGEVGVGKTLLCRRLLEKLNEMDVCSCFVFNPNLPMSELKKTILSEFGIKKAPKNQYFEAINKHLIKNAESGKETILVIDEGQTLTDEGLEFVRALTNLEMASRKLLQIVMFAQPELVGRLQSDHLKQLAQRFSYVCELKTIPEEKLERYLAARLISAGHPHGHILTKKALSQLWSYTNGNPRLVNTVTKKAMLAAFADDRIEVGAKDIEVAAKESAIALRNNQEPVSEVITRGSYWFWAMLGYASLATVALIIFGIHELHL